MRDKRLLILVILIGVTITAASAWAQADANYYQLMMQCQAAGGDMWANGHCLHCPYGLASGSGAVRCADNPAALPPPPQAATQNPLPNQRIQGDFTAQDNGSWRYAQQGHYAQRPAGMPSPRQDPGWCARNAHGASALNKCVVEQDQEYVPSQSEVENVRLPSLGGGGVPASPSSPSAGRCFGRLGGCSGLSQEQIQQYQNSR